MPEVQNAPPPLELAQDHELKKKGYVCFSLRGSTKYTQSSPESSGIFDPSSLVGYSRGVLKRHSKSDLIKAFWFIILGVFLLDLSLTVVRVVDQKILGAILHKWVENGLFTYLASSGPLGTVLVLGIVFLSVILIFYIAGKQNADEQFKKDPLQLFAAGFEDANDTSLLEEDAHDAEIQNRMWSIARHFNNQGRDREYTIRYSKGTFAISWDKKEKAGEEKKPEKKKSLLMELITEGGWEKWPKLGYLFAFMGTCAVAFWIQWEIASIVTGGTGLIMGDPTSTLSYVISFTFLIGFSLLIPLFGYGYKIRNRFKKEDSASAVSDEVQTEITELAQFVYFCEQQHKILRKIDPESATAEWSPPSDILTKRHHSPPVAADPSKQDPAPTDNFDLGRSSSAGSNEEKSGAHQRSLSSQMAAERDTPQGPPSRRPVTSLDVLQGSSAAQASAQAVPQRVEFSVLSLPPSDTAEEKDAPSESALDTKKLAPYLSVPPLKLPGRGATFRYFVINAVGIICGFEFFSWFLMSFTAHIARALHFAKPEEAGFINFLTGNLIFSLAIVCTALLVAGLNTRIWRKEKTKEVKEDLESKSEVQSSHGEPSEVIESSRVSALDVETKLLKALYKAARLAEGVSLKDLEKDPLYNVKIPNAIDIEKVVKPESPKTQKTTLVLYLTPFFLLGVGVAQQIMDSAFVTRDFGWIGTGSIDPALHYVRYALSKVLGTGVIPDEFLKLSVFGMGISIFLVLGGALLYAAMVLRQKKAEAGYAARKQNRTFAPLHAECLKTQHRTLSKQHEKLRAFLDQHRVEAEKVKALQEVQVLSTFPEPDFSNRTLETKQRLQYLYKFIGFVFYGLFVLTVTPFFSSTIFSVKPYIFEVAILVSSLAVIFLAHTLYYARHTLTAQERSNLQVLLGGLVVSFTGFLLLYTLPFSGFKPSSILFLLPLVVTGIFSLRFFKREAHTLITQAHVAIARYEVNSLVSEAYVVLECALDAAIMAMNPRDKKQGIDIASWSGADSDASRDQLLKDNLHLQYVRARVRNRQAISQADMKKVEGIFSRVKNARSAVEGDILSADNTVFVQIREYQESAGPKALEDMVSNLAQVMRKYQHNEAWTDKEKEQFEAGLEYAASFSLPPPQNQEQIDIQKVRDIAAHAEKAINALKEAPSKEQKERIDTYSLLFLLLFTLGLGAVLAGIGLLLDLPLWLEVFIEGAILLFASIKLAANTQAITEETAAPTEAAPASAPVAPQASALPVEAASAAAAPQASAKNRLENEMEMNPLGSVAPAAVAEDSKDTFEESKSDTQPLLKAAASQASGEKKSTTQPKAPVWQRRIAAMFLGMLFFIVPAGIIVAITQTIIETVFVSPRWLAAFITLPIVLSPFLYRLAEHFFPAQVPEFAKERWKQIKKWVDKVALRGVAVKILLGLPFVSVAGGLIGAIYLPLVKLPTFLTPWYVLVPLVLAMVTFSLFLARLSMQYAFVIQKKGGVGTASKWQKDLHAFFKYASVAFTFVLSLSLVGLLTASLFLALPPLAAVDRSLRVALDIVLISGWILSAAFFVRNKFIAAQQAVVPTPQPASPGLSIHTENTTLTKVFGVTDMLYLPTFRSGYNLLTGKADTFEKVATPLEMFAMITSITLSVAKLYEKGGKHIPSGSFFVGGFFAVVACRALRDLYIATESCDLQVQLQRRLEEYTNIIEQENVDTTKKEALLKEIAAFYFVDVAENPEDETRKELYTKYAKRYPAIKAVLDENRRVTPEEQAEEEKFVRSSLQAQNQEQTKALLHFLSSAIAAAGCMLWGAGYTSLLSAGIAGDVTRIVWALGGLLKLSEIMCVRGVFNQSSVAENTREEFLQSLFEKGEVKQYAANLGILKEKISEFMWRMHNPHAELPAPFSPSSKEQDAAVDAYRLGCANGAGMQAAFEYFVSGRSLVMSAGKHEDAHESSASPRKAPVFTVSPGLFFHAAQARGVANKSLSKDAILPPPPKHSSSIAGFGSSPKSPRG